MEFFTDRQVKRSNDQGIVLLDTYAVSNGIVTVTSPSPMGNHILEFRIEQDRLVLSSGEIFYKQTNVNANAGSRPSTPAIIPVDADRAEVLKQAEINWKRIWVQNGDTWIAKQKDYPYLVEIKGRRLEVNAGALSEIDRLNGIQWQGIVVVACTAERKFAFQSSEGTISGLSDPYHSGWNDWSTPQDAAAAYRFRKKNNQWASLKLETFDTGSMRGEMVRPRAVELGAAGIKAISQDSDEDVAFEKQRTNFMSWLRMYFAKGNEHRGEQTGGYHVGAIPYTFTLTMTADPIIQAAGVRDMKVNFRAFAKLHWHGQFNSGRGTAAQPAFYVDQDRVELRSENIDLSKLPFAGMFKWFFIDAAGKELGTSAYSSVLRGCGFQKNEYTLEPVVGETGGTCQDSGRVTSARTTELEKRTESAATGDSEGGAAESPGLQLQDAGASGPNHAVALNNPSQNATGENRAATIFVGERFPQTRTRALAAADIQAWSNAQLQYAINEMFARHGAEFGNRAIVKWFAQFPWYKPQPGLNFDDIERAMSEVERQNVRRLGEYRTARKGVGNQLPLNARNQHGKGTRAKQDQTRPDPVAQKFLESILRGVVQGLENSH